MWDVQSSNDLDIGIHSLAIIKAGKENIEQVYNPLVLADHLSESITQV